MKQKEWQTSIYQPLSNGSRSNSGVIATLINENGILKCQSELCSGIHSKLRDSLADNCKNFLPRHKLHHRTTSWDIWLHIRHQNKKDRIVELRTYSHPQLKQNFHFGELETFLHNEWHTNQTKAPSHAKLFATCSQPVNDKLADTRGGKAQLTGLSSGNNTDGVLLTFVPQ